MNKILIIEDEEAIAELERDYLTVSDFDVTIKTTGTAERTDNCRTKAG